MLISIDCVKRLLAAIIPMNLCTKFFTEAIRCQAPCRKLTAFEYPVSNR